MTRWKLYLRQKQWDHKMILLREIHKQIEPKLMERREREALLERVGSHEENQQAI